MTSVYLVRHGQASLGAENYDQLSALGREQAALLGQHWHALKVRFEQAWCGSLVRQVDTAHAILSTYHNAGAHAPALRRDPRFDEYDFDPILKTYAFTQGINAIPMQDPRKFYEFLRSALSAWVSGALSSPAVPNWAAFASNCASAFSELAAAANRDSRILLVTSGGVISAVLCHVLRTPPEKFVDFNLAIRNSAVTRIEIHGSGMYLHSFNGLPHIEQLNRSHLVTLA